MAVLIGIAAPAMLRYVEKAKLAQANYNAKVVYDYVEDYIIECYVNSNLIDTKNSIKIPIYKYDAGTMSVLYNGTKEDLANYLRMCFDSDEDDSEADYVVVNFTGKGVEDENKDMELISATWAAKITDDMVGSYPTPAVGRATDQDQAYAKVDNKWTTYYEPNLGEQ